MLIIDPCLPDQSRVYKMPHKFNLHHQITLLVVLFLAGLVTVSGWFKESSDKIGNQMLLIRICIISVQSHSCVWLFVTPRTAAHQTSLSITNSRSLFKLMSIESVMPYNHLIFCCPLLLPSVFSSIRVFSNESALHIRWPKYWSFSISPSNEYSGPISFKIYQSDLLAVQGTLKSLLQHHRSKASILWCSAFFMVQLSHPYMTTRKTIALTRWTFIGKVMSLLFNMLPRFVIAFFQGASVL